MAKTTEHSERDENEIFLESTKAFHLEMPLYNHINISKKSIREKIFEHLNYSGTIDAYCVWCGKESVFNNVEHINITVEWKHEYVKETPFEAWESRGYGIQKVTYACTRNSGHEYYSYYIRGGNDIFVKFGQYPSGADFQIPQAEKYRKVLGEERYKEMTRGLGLIAHGVGIGSFVYLRRVFESLIEEAHVLVQEDSNFDDEKFKKAHIDEKILLLKQHLPNFLVQ